MSKKKLFKQFLVSSAYSFNLFHVCLDGIRESYSIQTLLALMKVANVEEDELSEQLQKNLIKKAIDLDTYVTEMLRLRKSYNLRRIKIDKLTELENSGQLQRLQYPNLRSSSSTSQPADSRR